MSNRGIPENVVSHDLARMWFEIIEIGLISVAESLRFGPAHIFVVGLLGTRAVPSRIVFFSPTEIEQHGCDHEQSYPNEQHPGRGMTL